MEEREAGLAQALSRIRGVDIDEAAIRAHVMWPQHLQGAGSDRGREDGPAKHFIWPPGPVLSFFDANGFKCRPADGASTDLFRGGNQFVGYCAEGIVRDE